MELQEFVVLIATLLVGIVAGFLVAFALIVMPGIAKLSDREFIRAFQQMDGIIQRGHPLFLVLWVGSVISLLAASVVAWQDLGVAGRYLIGASAAVYLLGVQLPTAMINIPLNNRIQAVDTHSADDSRAADARREFETPWNRSNDFRTVLACVVFAMMLVVIGMVV